jgi:hypothetical protein
MDIPFLYQDGIPWPGSVHGSCQTDRKSLLDSVIELWKSQPKGLRLLPQGEILLYALA